MFGMHSLNILGCVIRGEKKEVESSSAILIATVNTEKLDITFKYYVGERKSFLGLFDISEKEDVTFKQDDFDKWEFLFPTRDSDVSKSVKDLKTMGVASIVGYGVLGPAGAAAGALLKSGGSNKKDIPVIVRHKNIDLILHCLCKPSFVKELDRMEFFSENS
ncbi:hypothetical protein [Vibrio sp. M260118]|uniref:hypothetical protein n=1 Tax=Vibrio sp. M260118 TaxID=3020896 RepID=UPI002F42A649